MLDLDKVINKLINLNDEKYTLVNELLELTEKQAEVIEINDIDGLNLLINRKQDKIDNVKIIDVQIDAIVNDLKMLYEINCLNELESKCPKISILNVRILETKSIIKEIIKIDEVNRVKIQESRDQLQDKIANASKGKNAINQYGNFSNYANSYFFDQKIK